MRNRAATPADVPRCAAIEDAAGEMFAEVGVAEIAADPEPSAETISGYVAAGRAFVTVDGDDRPVAYAMVDWVDGDVHIEQLSVDPVVARRGIGAQLLGYVHEWAARNGARAVTLTTFRDVPWNAPYYARLGYRVLADGEAGAGLADVRTAEARAGLDRWPRVAMRRPL